MRAGLFACTLLTAPVVANVPPPVSVEHAAFHRLVFANEDVAVLDNLFPPGSDSGFHLHPRELFYVIVAPAMVSTQKPGQAIRPLPPIVAGSVGYNVLTAEPFIHRVVNHDRQPFHLIGIEIRRPAPLGDKALVRGPGYVQVFDNLRLRAWRLILAPGQSAPPVRQEGPGVRVVVRGGSMTVSEVGHPDQLLVVENGDFQEVTPGNAHAIENSGSTTIELVEVELK
jgi:mannose-6-phosphate isomerase-like protein (cupin superfamily)